MRKKKVYLSHSVHERKRGNNVQRLLELLGFTVWNPFYSNERSDVKKLDSGKTKPWSFTSKKKSTELVDHDLEAISLQSLVVALFPEKRRTVGIPCEMFFAHRVMGIPVYAVTKSLNGHPWVLDCSKKIFCSDEELIEYFST